MSINDLPIEDKIGHVESNKNELLRHTTILSEHLQQLTFTREAPPRTLDIIRREIRTIINELAKLKPFCDADGQRSIELYSETGAEFTRYSTKDGFVVRKPFIEYWASKTVGIAFSYDKYPFSVTSGLDINWDFMKMFVKMEYKRLGFPGGKIGGLVSIIIFLIIIYFLLFNK